MTQIKFKFLVLSIILLASTFVFSQEVEKDYLIKIYQGEYDEVGVPSGYINLKGDTVIALGKYFYCYTDTLKKFAIVLKKGDGCIAIDRNENKLFEVFWYDNGPDYISEGLFRIKNNVTEAV